MTIPVTAGSGRPVTRRSTRTSTARTRSPMFSNRLRPSRSAGDSAPSASWRSRASSACSASARSAAVQRRRQRRRQAARYTRSQLTSAPHVAGSCDDCTRARTHSTSRALCHRALSSRPRAPLGGRRASECARHARPRSPHHTAPRAPLRRASDTSHTDRSPRHESRRSRRTPREHFATGRCQFPNQRRGASLSTLPPRAVRDVALALQIGQPSRVLKPSVDVVACQLCGRRCSADPGVERLQGREHLTTKQARCRDCRRCEVTRDRITTRGRRTEAQRQIELRRSSVPSPVTHHRTVHPAAANTTAYALLYRAPYCAAY